MKTVLCLNGGSSSLKFAAFAVGGAEPRALARGGVDRIGTPNATLHVRGDDRSPRREEPCEARDLRAVVPLVSAALTRLGVGWDAVGHRIVHGGPEHLQPERIDDRLIASLRDAIAFAPLHLPGELALIEEVSKQNAALPQASPGGWPSPPLSGTPECGGTVFTVFPTNRS